MKFHGSEPRIRLESNFRDFYDHRFVLPCDPDFEGILFRDDRSGPLRSKAFRILERHGYHVPRHGTILEMAYRFWENEKLLPEELQVVVYETETSHRGLDKVRMLLSQALVTYPPDTYCSQYISGDEIGVSYRHLRIGALAYWFQYSFGIPGEWRSNVQDENGQLEDLGPDFIPDYKGPDISRVMEESALVAIDFIKAEGQMIALDLNTAPRLAGTGLEDLLSPLELYNLLASWLILRQKTD